MQGAIITKRPLSNGVLKGLFVTFGLAVLLTLTIQNSFANSAPSAAQIAQLAKNGQTSSAANLLSSQTNIPSGDALKFAQGLQSGKVDLASATDFASGALSGKINGGNIGDATSILKNVQSGQGNLGAINSLISKVGGGEIPTDIGKTLSQFEELGNIGDIKSLGDVFKNPTIQNVLGDQLQKAGIPSDVTNLIGDIAGIATNPQAFAQEAIAQAASQAITQAIQQASPELAAALNNLLGGAGGLQGAIASALGAQAGGAQQAQQQAEQQQGGQGGEQCSGCNCNVCIEKINQNHNTIKAHTTAEFEQHRNWIVNDFYINYIAPTLMRMTSTFVTNMMLQMEIIGTFFDAKHQLETQRLIQTLTAKAHKDYHPNEGLCEIGTNTKSLFSSERRSNLAHQSFAKRMMDRQLLTGGGITAEGGESDRRSRLDLFIRKFCNKNDHGEGLKKLCESGGTSKEQINMDIDYTGAFENKLTLEIDFTDEGTGPATKDEENLFALSANLFSNEIADVVSEGRLANLQNEPYALADRYLDLRSIAAKRSVAQNSFSAITGMKTQGDKEVGPFLKAILVEAGINPEDIEERLGKNPSYFAQMEVLTKDLFQNPTFYSNLYDKPVNIERKGAALQAIELIQDRDLYQSLLRSEAVLATLIETLLQQEHQRISGDQDTAGSSSSSTISTGGGT